MIVTRTWLNNFIDMSKVSDEKLYETLNSIGLEVDSIKTYTIPQKVVVGEVISCEKHPNADKLNVCQIDIGDEIKQIVCGAANVVKAKYVAVATIGAKLGDDFEIKHAELRGVESEGMICSASELGLPKLGNGILILDETIGKLKLGEELNNYKKLADTIIEIELTANRGDCLSIYGVARDLSAALQLSLKPVEYESQNLEKIGLARVAEIKTSSLIQGSLKYVMADIEHICKSLIISIRLAFIGEKTDTLLEDVTKYVTHTTGVILRAYKTRIFLLKEEDKITITASTKDDITTIEANGQPFSILGVSQNEVAKADDKTVKVLFEASYINPNILVDAVAEQSLETDELYYNTSRGSEPCLDIGMTYLISLLERHSGCNFFDGSLSVQEEIEDYIITIKDTEVSDIIGKKIEKTEMVNILSSLGFAIQSSSEDLFAVTVPPFRHDIVNIQDITEEIVRIIGIDNIESKALRFTEKQHINNATIRHQARKALRTRATANGFDESISYAFSDKTLLQKYGFSLVKEELDIINPITEDFNTLRSTILVNLLIASKRNVSYSQRAIALFEMGTVFDTNRQEKELFSLIFSGQRESENISNAGKPQAINFETFTKKLSAIIGNFQLRSCTQHNALLHPYQSADIIIDNKVCGFMSKLHPTVASEFDLADTFIAEISFEALIPEHINASAISNFQGVYKDLSLVIDKNIPYHQIATSIESLELKLLKKYFPVDIYEDTSLENKKSLTVRLFIQSLTGTLEDRDSETITATIIDALQEQYGATLR
jgi:phenylalanyl-tRNA synthetase beta chain